MRKNIPNLFPSISLDLLRSLLDFLKSDEVSCYMKHKNSNIRLMIDLPSGDSEKILTQMYDFYFRSKNEEIIKCLKKAVKESRCISEGVAENMLNLNDEIIDSKKKKLFQKCSSFANFLTKVPEKQYNEVVEQVFSVIGCKNVNRDIDDEEFSIIKKVSNVPENKLYDRKILLLHDKNSNKLSLFYPIEEEEKAIGIKKRLERKYYFNLKEQIEDPSQTPILPFRQEKKKSLIKRFNKYLSISNNKGKVHAIQGEDSSFVLKKFDEESLNKFKIYLSEKGSTRLYFFNILIDLPQRLYADFSSSCEQIINDEHLDMSFFSEKFEQYETFFDFVPRNEMMSVSFLGKSTDLFKYFKSKPKILFQTTKFYIFCERNETVDKILSKLLFKHVFHKVDHEEADSLFIDLSNIMADKRFICLKNILKNCGGNTNVDSCSETGTIHSWKTPTKPKPENDQNSNNGYSTGTTQKYFSSGTAEKYVKKYDINNYRGYNSEKKEEIARKIFSDDEEKSFLDNLSEKKNERDSKTLQKYETSYQSLQEKKGSQGGKDKVMVIPTAEKVVYEIPKHSKIDISLDQYATETRLKLEKVGETRTTTVYCVDSEKKIPSSKKSE